MTYRLVLSGAKNLDGSRKDAELTLSSFITEVNHGLVPEGKQITFGEYSDL